MTPQPIVYCERCGGVAHTGTHFVCMADICMCGTREIHDPPGGNQGRAESTGAGGGAEGTQNVGPGAPRRVSSTIPGNGGA